MRCVGECTCPYNAAPPQEEVATATPCPPDGGSKRDGTVEVAYGPPARLVVGKQAELYGGFTPARTEQCGRPRTGVFADKIEPLSGKDVRQVIDCEGGEPRAQPRALDEAPPESQEISHAASLARLSSAQSRSGETSPRPT